MDLTILDAKRINSLEDYAVFLGAGLLSLMSLQNGQVMGIEAGIMTDDLQTSANVLIWDLRRLIELYKKQLIETCELLPEEFSPENTINNILRKK